MCPQLFYDKECIPNRNTNLDPRWRETPDSDEGWPTESMTSLRQSLESIDSLDNHPVALRLPHSHNFFYAECEQRRDLDGPMKAHAVPSRSRLQRLLETYFRDLRYQK
jgi:hypothetical protein